MLVVQSLHSQIWFKNYMRVVCTDLLLDYRIHPEKEQSQENARANYVPYLRDYEFGYRAGKFSLHSLYDGEFAVSLL
jgi:hypothetical protein